MSIDIEKLKSYGLYNPKKVWHWVEEFFNDHALYKYVHSAYLEFEKGKYHFRVKQALEMVTPRILSTMFVLLDDPDLPREHTHLKVAYMYVDLLGPLCGFAQRYRDRWEAVREVILKTPDILRDLRCDVEKYGAYLENVFC